MANAEELILVAEDCFVSKSSAPPLGKRKTIARIGYEILHEQPYVFTEQEFFHELHVVRRGRTDLKLESYNIKRAALVKEFGWGIHRDKLGKLGLVAMESDEYRRLQATIRVVNAYRTNRK